MKLTNAKRYSFFKEESGQGVTEYGAVLCLAAILVAFLWAPARSMVSSVSSTFNAPVTALNDVSSYAGETGTGTGTGTENGAGGTDSDSDSGSGSGSGNEGDSGSSESGSGSGNGNGYGRGRGNSFGFGRFF